MPHSNPSSSTHQMSLPHYSGHNRSEGWNASLSLPKSGHQHYPPRLDLPPPVVPNSTSSKPPGNMESSNGPINDFDKATLSLSNASFTKSGAYTSSSALAAKPPSSPSRMLSNLMPSPGNLASRQPSEAGQAMLRRLDASPPQPKMSYPPIRQNGYGFNSNFGGPLLPSAGMKSFSTSLPAPGASHPNHGHSQSLPSNRPLHTDLTRSSHSPEIPRRSSLNVGLASASGSKMPSSVPSFQKSK